MAADQPLTGVTLIDCARANAAQGITTAAHLCGYGNDLNRFKQAVQQECQRMGVEFHELSDLITDQTTLIQMGGVEVAPDTTAEL